MRVRGMDAEGNSSVHQLYRVLISSTKGQECRLELEDHEAEELARLKAEAYDAGVAVSAAEEVPLDL